MQVENVREMLTEETARQLENVKLLEPGSKEEQAVIENIATLVKLTLEDDKIGVDYEEKSERRAMDKEERQVRREMDSLEREGNWVRQDKEALRNQTRAEVELAYQQEQDFKQMIVQYVKIGAEIVAIVLPIGVSGLLVAKGFRFEYGDNESFTSTTLRNLWSNVCRFVRK